MGLDDEMEKLRQAGQWLKDGSQQQKEAALDQIGHVLCHSTRTDLRAKAWALLHEGDKK
jgi:hypothetical protein